MMSFSLDDPPNSRLFVVAGRNTSVSSHLDFGHQSGEVGECLGPNPSLILFGCSLSSSGVCLNNMDKFHSLNICVTKVS